jgi:hypothetical protein
MTQIRPHPSLRGAQQRSNPASSLLAPPNDELLRSARNDERSITGEPRAHEPHPRLGRGSGHPRLSAGARRVAQEFNPQITQINAERNKIRNLRKSADKILFKGSSKKAALFEKSAQKLLIVFTRDVATSPGNSTE